MGEVGGLLVGATVRETYPSPVCWVTVRLPVTATALDGTPPCPATAKVRAAPDVNFPGRPRLMRVSRTREGEIGTLVEPAPVLSWEMNVAQVVSRGTYSLPCQAALGSWGSCATPT